MAKKQARLLEPDRIPDSLWDPASKTLTIASALATAYVDLVKDAGLEELAASRDPKNPPVGGPSKDSVDKYLAQAFDGAAARTELAFLDPLNDVAHASDAFVQLLSQESICLIDAPCGSGAASYSFLATVAELRARDVLPREPLDVVLIGAEISEHQREYADNLLKRIRPALKEQALFVDASFQHWNVTDQKSTVDLVRQIILSEANTAALLLVVANFNAFLVRESKQKASRAQLSELFKYASGPNHAGIWIEPNMNAASQTYGWLRKLFQSTLGRFVREHNPPAEEQAQYTSEAKFTLPLTPNQTAAVRLAVMRLDLEPSP